MFAALGLHKYCWITLLLPAAIRGFTRWRHFFFVLLVLAFLIAFLQVCLPVISPYAVQMTDPLTSQFLVFYQPPYRLPRDGVLGRDLWDRQPVSCFNHIACCNLCNYLYKHDLSFRRRHEPYRQKSARSRHFIHSEGNKVAVRLAKSPKTAKLRGVHVFAGGTLLGVAGSRFGLANQSPK